MKLLYGLWIFGLLIILGACSRPSKPLTPAMGPGGLDPFPPSLPPPPTNVVITFKGVVHSSGDQSPISGAAVALSTDSGVSTITDSNGAYTLSHTRLLSEFTNAVTIAVCASKTNYSKNCRDSTFDPISLSTGEVFQTLDFTLSPAPSSSATPTPTPSPSNSPPPTTCLVFNAEPVNIATDHLGALFNGATAVSGLIVFVSGYYAQYASVSVDIPGGYAVLLSHGANAFTFQTVFTTAGNIPITFTPSDPFTGVGTPCMAYQQVIKQSVETDPIYRFHKDMGTSDPCGIDYLLTTNYAEGVNAGYVANGPIEAPLFRVLKYPVGTCNHPLYRKHNNKKRHFVTFWLQEMPDDTDPNMGYEGLLGYACGAAETVNFRKLLRIHQNPLCGHTQYQWLNFKSSINSAELETDVSIWGWLWDWKEFGTIPKYVLRP